MVGCVAPERRHPRKPTLERRKSQNAEIPQRTDRKLSFDDLE